MKKKIAYIDLDGVVADYYGALSTAIQPKYSGFNPSAFYNNPEIVQEIIQTRNTPDWWLNLDIIPGSIRLLEKIKQYDYDLHILTKIPHESYNAPSEKVKWVKNNLQGLITDVHLTTDKSVFQGDLIVDDHWENILRWRDINIDGRAIYIGPRTHLINSTILALSLPVQNMLFVEQFLKES